MRYPDDKTLLAPQQYDDIHFVNNKTITNTLNFPIPKRKTINEILYNNHKSSDYIPDVVDENGFPILKGMDAVTINKINESHIY